MQDKSSDFQTLMAACLVQARDSQGSEAGMTAKNLHLLWERVIEKKHEGCSGGPLVLGHP